MQAAQAFYEKHGGKAIIIARFVPLVRTFVPVVAGAAGMGYRRLRPFNIIGGIAWVSSMTLGGYFLGTLFPELGRHIEKVIVVIVLSRSCPWWSSTSRPELVRRPRSPRASASSLAARESSSPGRVSKDRRPGSTG